MAHRLAAEWKNGRMTVQESYCVVDESRLNCTVCIDAAAAAAADGGGVGVVVGGGGGGVGGLV